MVAAGTWRPVWSNSKADTARHFSFPTPSGEQRGSSRRAGVDKSTVLSESDPSFKLLDLPGFLVQNHHVGKGAASVYAEYLHGRPTITSERRSAIIKTVGLIAARTKSGMIDASMTFRFSIPRTFPYWSTTAMGSEAGPILQVQLM